jgi:hypothetical protein
MHIETDHTYSGLARYRLNDTSRSNVAETSAQFDCDNAFLDKLFSRLLCGSIIGDPYRDQFNLCRGHHAAIPLGIGTGRYKYKSSF